MEKGKYRVIVTDNEGRVYRSDVSVNVVAIFTITTSSILLTRLMYL